MSVVVLQVGQCGNQIGQKFWNLNLQNSQSLENCVFNHLDGKLRSVNIDAESKVIRRLQKDIKKSNLRENNVVLGKRGCGTNWAIGYHGLKSSGDHLLEGSLESIRKEVERCDRFTGFLMMHSLSGGTGSGLGSHILECLRDLYPLSFTISNVVAPHLSGESPLQHYNALLTMAHLQSFADGILLIQNDEVLHQLSKAKKDSGISFAHMNDYIASCMAGLYMPTDTLASKNGFKIGLEPVECIQAVCPMPPVKFFTVNQVSKRQETWDSLSKSLLQTVNKYDLDGIPYASLSNLVVARGDKTHSYRYSQEKIVEKIKTSYNCVKWNPFPVDTWTAQDNHSGMKDSSSLTVAANSSSVVTYLEHVFDRAKTKYENNAYLHWFWKHGCCKTDFENAFDTINSVIDSYKSATS
ncbi:tubulin delta chain-like isoform X1 [Tubulanus polymorphus]|uniref:tubulin delta chain-like isoform X1 n=1 Tax=Tubulanus polymorphus TaxID=672921 RepID=UPI003DA5B4FA